MIDFINENLTADWMEHGVESHWWKGPTGSHEHLNICEIIIILQGKATDTYNGKSVNLQANQIVVHPPYGSHDIIPNSPEDIIHLNFSAEETLFRDICASIDPQILEIIFDNKKTQTIQISKVEMNYIIHAAEDIHSIRNDSMRYKAILSRALLSNIITIIYTKLIVKDSLQYKTTIPFWLSNVLDQISSPEYFSMSLAEIYKLSGYSQCMFAKHFKSYMGQTLVAYLTDKKIDYACKLLTETKHNVLYIANVCGYSSLSHFNHIFMKKMGCTPTEYRKDS